MTTSAPTSGSTTADSSLARINLAADNFVNKSCIIYGKSESGKSMIIKHILYLLKDHNPTTIVFSLSEKNNGSYSRVMVPRCLVHDSVTEEIIRMIAQRQTRARELYRQVNKIAILEKLFARISTNELRTIHGELQNAYDEIASKRALDEETEMRFEERMIKFLRAAIEPHLAQLNAVPDLDVPEKLTLKCFWFNPRITVVFDDCTTEMARLKNCPEALEQIFQGRHYFCTTIISLHGESVVLPIMRAGVPISIFTDPQVARQFAMRATNGFGKSKKELILRYADQVRAEKVGPFTKMVFTNDRPYLFEAPMHGSFSAVSPGVRAFCERVTKKERDDIATWMKEQI